MNFKEIAEDIKNDEQSARVIDYMVAVLLK
jgi:hypothetical protein